MHVTALLRQSTRAPRLLPALALLAVAGCASVPRPQPQAPADFDARAELEAEREAAAESAEPAERETVQAPDELSADLLDIQEPPAAQARFDVQAENVPVQRFFADLGRTQDLNILVDPDISGSLSLSMRSVTIDQVMSAVRDLYGYDYRHTDYGYRVLPNQIQTRIYQLNYLNINRSGNSDTTVSSGQITDQESGGTPASSVATRHSANFWEGMETTLLGLLEDQAGRQVVVNAQTGLLVVRATPREHELVTDFLDDAEVSLQKQVVIEAKIIEVTLNNEFRSGINWNTFANDLTRTTSDSGAVFDGNPLNGVPDIGGVFSLSIQSGDFGAMLDLLSNQGDVQVLSSPRVATVNNQKAVIKVGTDEFFVTDVSSSTSDNDGDGVSETTPDFTLAPFFSGIALDVTPQISAEDNVILHVRPSVTEVVERTKVINVGGNSYDLPLALSSVRETDSIIRAASGEIVVIGGLLSRQQDSSVTGLPWLAQVPGLNYLFAQNRESQSKSELIILLKPVVHDEQTTVDDLDRILGRIR